MRNGVRTRIDYQGKKCFIEMLRTSHRNDTRKAKALVLESFAPSVVAQVLTQVGWCWCPSPESSFVLESVRVHPSEPETRPCRVMIPDTWRIFPSVSHTH